MSAFQILAYFLGIPTLTVLVSVGLGLLLNSQGLLSPNIDMFYFFFGGFLIGIALVFVCWIAYANKKTSEKIKSKNQKAISQKKKLPMSYSNTSLKFGIVAIITCVFYILGANLLKSNYIHTIPPAYILIPFFICFAFLILLIAKYDESKGSVLVASNLFKEKFNNVETFKDNNYKFSDKNTPFARSLHSLPVTDWFDSNLKRSFVTSINFNYNNKACTIGNTDIKLISSRSHHRYLESSHGSSQYLRNAYIKNFAFIEIEHNVPFNHDINILKNFTYLDDIIKDKGILPEYKNLGLIYCSNKNYAERIMNEEIQRYIAELRAYFRNFSISFIGNKITVSIENAKWSSWFFRTFFPNAASKSILDSTNVLLEYLTKISYELEKLQERYK